MDYSVTIHLHVDVGMEQHAQVYSPEEKRKIL